MASKPVLVSVRLLASKPVLGLSVSEGPLGSYIVIPPDKNRDISLGLLKMNKVKSNRSYWHNLDLVFHADLPSRKNNLWLDKS